MLDTIACLFNTMLPKSVLCIHLHDNVPCSFIACEKSMVGRVTGRELLVCPLHKEDG